MPTIKISVAMAAYNGERYILKQLETIRQQSLNVDEVIIMDDGSSDETVDIVQNYINKYHLNHWHIFQNEKNKGYALNFYEAIKRCSGSLIFLCDQDDLWYPDKVKIVTELMDAHTDIMSVSTSYDLCDAEGEIIPNPGISHVRTKNDGTIEYLSLNDFMGSSCVRGCTMCIRKSIIDGEKLYDLKSNLGHDWLLNVYACLKGKNVYLNRKLSAYRIHQNNSSFSVTKKKALKSTAEKRILGLKEELLALKDLKTRSDIDLKTRKDFIKEIRFARCRKNIIQNCNIIAWILAIRYFSKYKKVYGTSKGGAKVYVGDLLYALEYKKIS